MQKYLNQSVLGLIVLIKVSWISINLSHLPVGLENRAYYANITSLIEDFDLNIINNVPRNSAWIVSQTYNYPDMHFEGETLLHFPLTAFSRLIKPFFSPEIAYGNGRDSIYLFSMGLTTLFLFYLSLKNLQGSIFEGTTRKTRNILWLFLLSSPVLYWTLSDFSSTDSLCFFLSTCLLSFMLKSAFDHKNDFFVLGALMGFGLILKPSFFFYLPLIILFMAKKRPDIKKTLLFLAPLAVFVICKYINSYLRFGFLTFFTGYTYAFYVDSKILIPSLIQYFNGAFGMLHQAPWMIVVLVLSVLGVIKKEWRRHLLESDLLPGILIAVLGKIAFEILCLTHAETEFGFRRFVIDLPFLMFFIQQVMNLSSEKLKAATMVAFSLCLIYMLLYWPWYRAIDSLSPSPIGVFKMWEYYPVKLGAQEFILFLQKFNLFYYKEAFVLVCVLSLAITAAAIALRKKMNERIFAYALLCLCLLVTGLNISHNQKNVMEMKDKNYFSQMVVANNTNLFLYDEFFSEIGRDLLIAKYKKDRVAFEFSKKLALNYLQTLNDGIISDPIHFKEMNQALRVKPIIYMSDSITTDSIFNYESKTKFDEIIKR